MPHVNPYVIDVVEQGVLNRLEDVSIIQLNLMDFGLL